jgi:hypothetical protein
MTKDDLHKIANELGIIDLVKAAEEFERGDCEKICKSFAMKERRVEVAAALNRAADMIRHRAADDTPMRLPSHNTPVDFISYE